MHRNYDEKIICALIQTNNVKDASKLCGIGQTTIYSRLKDNEFLDAYNNARASIVEDATNTLQALLGEQIGIIASISRDISNAPQVRLNASDMLIKHFYKMTELNDITKRLEELENNFINRS